VNALWLEQRRTSLQQRSLLAQLQNRHTGRQRYSGKASIYRQPQRHKIRLERILLRAVQRQI
jgi:hypothetical protein